jgi:hypothetical protein
MRPAGRNYEDLTFSAAISSQAPEKKLQPTHGKLPAGFSKTNTAKNDAKISVST